MLLLDYIYIDEFVRNQDNVVFFLTHWHNDHLGGLNDKFDGTVLCTRITSILLRDRFPNVKVRIVEINKWVSNLACKILVLDANHLPGSLMLFFPTESILYTGDYRLNKSMRHSLIKRVKHVKTIYADGTYHDRNVKFLSEFDCIILMQEFVNTIPGKIAIGVYHIGTCSLLSKMGIKFTIDISVSENLRKCLLVMFSNCIVSESRFLIVNPRKFHNHVYTLIIPSSLWFSCQGHMEYVHDVVQDIKEQLRINFTCHSDYWDNMELVDELEADNLILLNQSRVNLQCS
jgi:hypothetical protein